MRIPSLLFIVAAVAASCGMKDSAKKSSVTYETKNFRVDSGCKGDSIPCAEFEVSYPVFSGLPAAADSAVINKMAQAFGAESPDTEGMTMEQMGNHFISQYGEFKKEAGEEFEVGGWYTTTTVIVELLSDSVLSLSVNSEFFTGGAHGGTGTSYINVDPATGKDIVLDDVLKPGYKQALTAAGEKAFRAVHQLSETDTLSVAGFEFPEDRFSLNDNYGFKKEGIAFFYNIYEIGAYAVGPTQIIIPYEEIKDWLKK